MTKTMKFAFGAALGILMLAGAPTAAFAQNDVSGQNIASLEFESTDVREALRALFKNVGVSYTIAPEVQGTITVSLKNVPFETALQNITRQVDATYRVEGGVYQIVRREEVAPPQTGGSDTGINVQTNKVRRRIKIRSADPQFIATMIGAQNGSQQFSGLYPEMSTLNNPFGGGGGGGMGGGMGGMGGGMMGGMGGGMMGGMGGGMMGGMGGGMMGGMGGGMGGGMMGGMGGGMGGGFGR